MPLSQEEVGGQYLHGGDGISISIVLVGFIIIVIKLNMPNKYNSHI